MSVRVHTYTTTTTTFTLEDPDGNEIEVNLDFEPWGSDVEHYGFRSDGALVVGYLAYDDTGTTESPLEGFGEVTKEQNTWGFSFSGYKDAYSAVEDRLYANAAEAYLTANNIPFDSDAAFFYVDLNEVGVEVPEPTDEQVFEEFSTGDPDVYRYALLENMNTTQPWATLITNPEDLANAKVLIEVKRSDFEKPEDYVPTDDNAEWNDVWGKARADKQVDNVVDEYCAWFRGEVYGMVVQVFRPAGFGEWVEDTMEEKYDLSVWGLIGDKYAESELKSTFDAAMIVSTE
jgi:hypothetical protein